VRPLASAESEREGRQGTRTQGAGTRQLRGFMAKPNHVEIPYLDPSVQHVGISRLRALNVTQLRELDKTLVIQDNDKPLAVLLKYEHFLAMQERMGEQ